MRLLPIVASITLALSSTVALSATQTITVFDGSAVTPTPNPAHPMVAVDASDRSHIVWSQETDENATTYYNIFYKLIAADGSTLIDATQLSSTSDNDDSYKPQIAVSGSDLVYVSWHTDRDGVSLIALDPSKDDLSGDAATLATIQRFAEVTDFTGTTTGGTFTRHDYIDVDSTGRVHILLLDGVSAFCGVYDSAGAVVTAPTTKVVDLAEVRGGGADVALDANDKMHIVTAYDGTNTKEISYSMVDCAAGTKLIDATTVSTDDTLPSMQPDLVYKDGTVYIMWIDSERGDNNCGNDPGLVCTEAANVMQFIALDPALDDQSGDAASLAAITKVATKSIAVPAAIESAWYPRMGLTENGELQVLYYTDSSTENLYGVTLDTNGDVVAAAAEIMNDNTTAEPTSQTKASVDNRSTVYPEAQNIILSLRDAFVPPVTEPPVTEPPATEPPATTSSSSSSLALSLWSLLGLAGMVGLLRARRRK